MIRYSTRLVLVLNDIVIKIPIDRRGYLQGLNESKMWNKYNAIAPLAELRWMWMGIVCQKRYNEATSITDAQVKEMKGFIPEFDFDNCDLYKRSNWGTDGNRYVLLDYGVNEYIASLYKTK
jgi:hypothetical protein